MPSVTPSMGRFDTRRCKGPAHERVRRGTDRGRPPNWPCRLSFRTHKFSESSIPPSFIRCSRWPRLTCPSPCTGTEIRTTEPHPIPSRHSDSRRKSSPLSGDYTLCTPNSTTDCPKRHRSTRPSAPTFCLRQRHFWTCQSLHSSTTHLQICLNSL